MSIVFVLSMVLLALASIALTLFYFFYKSPEVPLSPIRSPNSSFFREHFYRLNYDRLAPRNLLPSIAEEDASDLESRTTATPMV